MKKRLSVLLQFILIPIMSFASEGAVVDTGVTAWMITSTALVLLMIPGLALFYEIGRASCRERV